MCHHCGNNFDPEIERIIREDSETCKKAHKKLADYFYKHIGASIDLMNTAIVIISKAPDETYKVDFTGNISKDELYFGLGVAQEIIMKQTMSNAKNNRPENGK